MPEIKIKPDSSEARKRLALLKRKLNNLPWDKVGFIAQRSIQRNFDLGGRPSKWVPRKKPKPWPILKKRGDLKEANLIEPIPNGTSIVNRKPYQAVHNYGYPLKNIAKREYLLLQSVDFEEIENLFIKHLILR